MSAEAMTEMRGILSGYAAKGVPEELVMAAKRSEVASARVSAQLDSGAGECVVDGAGGGGAAVAG